MKTNELTKAVFIALANGQSLVDFRRERVDSLLSSLSDANAQDIAIRMGFEAGVNEGIRDALLLMVEGLPISVCNDGLFKSQGFRSLIEFGSAAMKQHNAKKGE